MDTFEQDLGSPRMDARNPAKAAFDMTAIATTSIHAYNRGQGLPISGSQSNVPIRFHAL